MNDDEPSEVHADVIAATPLKRLATADEISPGLVYLASDKASFVAGRRDRRRLSGAVKGVPLSAVHRAFGARSVPAHLRRDTQTRDYVERRVSEGQPWTSA